MVNRQGLETLIYDTYGVQADYPFERYPSVAVFRHTLGRKWFVVIMKIPKCRLGIDGEGDIDIVNFKCADEIIFSMRQCRNSLNWFLKKTNSNNQKIC